MELIILDDGIYSLVKVTKEMMKQIELFSKVDCFDLCDIIRLKLTTFNEFANRHVMNDGSGDFFMVVSVDNSQGLQTLGFSWR